jgi:hypothetical protein
MMAPVGSNPGALVGDMGHLTAAVPRMPPPSSRPRRALARDLAIGAAVAVLVVGLLVGGRFLFFRGGAGAATPAATGTIVVATVDGLPADVYVNGSKRGSLAGTEPLTLDQLPGGEYAVAVKRAGAPDCVQKVSLDVRRPEVVTCRFAPVAPAAGRLMLRLKTEGATVLVDNQEISAAAVAEPIQLAPDVEHQVTVQREGFVTQALQVQLKDGETQERVVELQAAEPVKGGSKPAGGEAKDHHGEHGGGAAATGGGKTEVGPGGGAGGPGGSVLGGGQKQIAQNDKTGGGKTEVKPGGGGEKAAGGGKTEVGPGGGAGGPGGSVLGGGSTGSGGSVLGGGSGGGEEKPPGDGGAETSPDGDVGYLIANTTPYAKVFIDNKDTGKMTPIAPRAKIGLKAGKHTVTFVIGDKKFSYPIQIEAGKDHRLIKTLPVE